VKASKKHRKAIAAIDRATDALARARAALVRDQGEVDEDAELLSYLSDYPAYRSDPAVREWLLAWKRPRQYRDRDARPCSM
jgi:hypothetical protein